MLPNRPRLSRYWRDLSERSPAASEPAIRLESRPSISGGSDCMVTLGPRLGPRLARGRELRRESYRLLFDKWREMFSWEWEGSFRSSVPPRLFSPSSDRLLRLYLWLGTRLKLGGCLFLTSDNSPFPSFSDLLELRSLEPSLNKLEELAVGLTWTSLKKA